MYVYVNITAISLKKHLANTRLQFFYILLLGFNDPSTFLTDDYLHFPRGILIPVYVTSIKVKNL